MCWLKALSVRLAEAAYAPWRQPGATSRVDHTRGVRATVTRCASPPARPDLQIDYLGGSVPVQGDGSVSGLPFYLRMRGEQATLIVVPEGLDPVADVVAALLDVRFDAPAGTWPAMGWVEPEDAQRWLEDVLQAWTSGHAAEVVEAALRLQVPILSR